MPPRGTNGSVNPADPTIHMNSPANAAGTNRKNGIADSTTKIATAVRFWVSVQRLEPAATHSPIAGPMNGRTTAPIVSQSKAWVSTLS